MTKLEMVQEVIRRLTGRTPPALDTGGASDAANAERVLIDNARRAATQGWAFNTKETLTLTPNGSGNIVMPSGTLWINTDGLDTYKNYVQIGDKLYDKTNNTYVFDQDVSVTVRLRYDPECFPEHIQHWLVSKTALDMLSHVGVPANKPTLPAQLREDEYAARIMAKKADGEIRGTNALYDNQRNRELFGDRTNIYRSGDDAI